MPSAPARQLSQLLETLHAAGTLTATELAGLSDLSREDAESVAGACAHLPAAERESLLTRALELAEDNVDLDFSRFAAASLDDPEAPVRRAAVRILWESEDRATIARLADLVRADDDEAVRAASAATLAGAVVRAEFDALDRETSERVTNALRAAADDASEAVDVRAAAIESLGARSLPWVTTLINDAYYAEDDRLRIAAIRAMGASADERWVEYLADLAVSDDPEVRFEAAQSLGAIASDEGLEPLFALLDDEDLEVVTAALQAVGGIGGDDVVELLTRLQAEPPEGLEEEVDAALEMARFVTTEGRGGE
ncbi:MAG: HEAT repeat domain-containing protein [Dehalococcoidia bacterium]|nr:HEAT repeat domain-containing protein [Dehalococcoidia bacterium]